MTLNILPSFFQLRQLRISFNKRYDNIGARYKPLRAMKLWESCRRSFFLNVGRRLLGTLQHLPEARTEPIFKSGYPEGQHLEWRRFSLDPPDSSSSISSKLPKSPLLDPKLNAARFGHKAPKAKARGNQVSEFQRKLRKNPYAQALATPIRQCNLTGAHLPQEFLLRFGLAPHPETGDRWHLPNIAANLASDGNGDDANENGETGPIVKGQKPRVLSGTHFLSSNSALQHVSSLPRPRYLGLVPRRWLDAGVVKGSEPVWREDMADFAADLLRKGAGDSLKSLAYRGGRNFIVGCEDWSKLNAIRQPAAVLYLRHNEGERGDTPPVDDPPAYAIIEHRGKRKLPVYNMTTLLGRSGLRELQKQDPELFGEMLAVVTNKRATIDVQRALWRLMGYLSH